MARNRLLAATLLAVSTPLAAQEPVDLDMVTRIREEGLRRSQVVETVRHLTDVLGPRVTGSPEMKAANEWTREKLAGWGLANARLEPYPFGRGWSFSRASVHMTRPRQTPLFALPKSFTPGTGGAVRGPVVIAELEEEEGFEAFRGKLAGKIVLLDERKDLAAATEVSAADPREHSPEALRELARYDLSEVDDPEEGKAKSIERYRLRRARDRFLVEEKALATLEASSRGWGVIRVSHGGPWDPAHVSGTAVPPGLVMAAEHYNLLHRLVESGQEVELEVEVEARFHDEDPMAYNTLAEIPGTDPSGEVVMAGAHLDSWHGGTGATDNAAGCAVVMEAVRILQALEVKPRRTIRVALWTGEEQALVGSVAHAAEHYGSWSGPADPERRAWLSRFRWRGEGELSLRPGHGNLSAYFNLDNGGGRIRGLYAEGNAAARPIFEAWLAPFHDLGADTVTLRSTGSTDHTAFLDVGLPGFQFIQDELDYSARTHHSHLDVFDHLDPEALRQASVVLASVLYHAAMRPESFPRPPLPNPSRP